MSKYYFSHKAIQDLTAIWDYTAKEWSLNQAEKYYNLLMASCKDLANAPTLGKSYDILSLDIYGYKCGQHIIFYSILSVEAIKIERILHGSMDLKSRL